MGNVTVLGWEKFQHYKKRNPPWIRLYRTLLDDAEWRALGDFSARLLVELWLLASEAKIPGTIEMDSTVLAWRLRYASKTPAQIHSALQELESHGFIGLTTSGASAALATCKQHARPDQIRSETEQSRAEAEIPNLSDSGNKALHELLERSPSLSPVSVVAIINAIPEGLHGDVCSWEAIGIGLVELAASGSSPVGTNAIVRFIQKAEQRLGSGGSMESQLQKMIDNG